ncbi:MAG: hypothetical protein J5936_00850, partial [Acholeplasmatales bacterium]|nr:hypothetical protein [Acholeplasmatales bacterium]
MTDNNEKVIPNVDSKSKEERNVPDLRFKIFTGNWQIIKLKSIVKETKCFTSNFEEYPLYSFTIENGVTPK